MRFLLAWLYRAGFLPLMAGACILPLGVLTRYAHPALDDFAIGVYLRHRSMWAYVAEVYRYRSGRYAAALSSVVIQYFGRHPAAYQPLLLAGLLAFVLSLYMLAFGAVGRRAGLGVQLGSLLVVVVLSGFPWPAEGIYWLTGSVAYLYPATLAALLWGLLLWLYAQPLGLGWRWIVATALAFFIPGFSEITALLLPLVGAGVLLARGSWRLPRRWAMVLGAGLVGSVLTLAAPSYFAKWQQLAPPLAGVGLPKAAALALAGASYCVVNWVGNGLLPLLVLLGLPLLLAAAQPVGGRSLVRRLTSQLLLWPSLTLGGLWLAFAFCYAATGMGPALRVKNLLYLYFVTGGLLSAYALARRLDPRYLHLLTARPVRLGLLVWILATFLTDHNGSLTHERIGEGANTVVQAYRDWLGGDAARYDQQQRTRYAQVRAAAPRAAPLRLDPLQTLPRTLFFYDISVNPQLWGNVAYAQFFGYPAVYVAAP